MGCVGGVMWVVWCVCGGVMCVCGVGRGVWQVGGGGGVGWGGWIVVCLWGYRPIVVKTNVLYCLLQYYYLCKKTDETKCLFNNTLNTLYLHLFGIRHRSLICTIPWSG